MYLYTKAYTSIFYKRQGEYIYCSALILISPLTLSVLYLLVFTIIIRTKETTTKFWLLRLGVCDTVSYQQTRNWIQLLAWVLTSRLIVSTNGGASMDFFPSWFHTTQACIAYICMGRVRRTYDLARHIPRPYNPYNEPKNEISFASPLNNGRRRL